MRCEDYPCCGHTPDDPCERQWYDEPDAFDLSRNPHALCEHEAGFCDVDDADDWDVDYEDGLTDVEADAMTLRDAGMGTDEDYGYYGEMEDYQD